MLRIPRSVPGLVRWFTRWLVRRITDRPLLATVAAAGATVGAYLLLGSPIEWAVGFGLWALGVGWGGAYLSRRRYRGRRSYGVDDPVDDDGASRAVLSLAVRRYANGQGASAGAGSDDQPPSRHRNG